MSSKPKSLGEIVFETTKPGPPRDIQWADLSDFDRRYYNNLGQAIARAVRRWMRAKERATS